MTGADKTENERIIIEVECCKQLARSDRHDRAEID